MLRYNISWIVAAILFDISGKYNLDWDLAFVLNVYAYEKQERNCL